MVVNEKVVRVSAGQERILKLLFKFRFISTQLLSEIMGTGRRSAYEVVELLVGKGLLDKVYETDFRYARKPAYYYLNKSGVTAVRKLMDVKESVVHPLYKNSEASEEFINHCLTVATCFIQIKKSLPSGSELFTKSEINRFSQFPKNRPDLYIRTKDGMEAIVVIIDDKPSFIIRKRLDEIIRHFEDEDWPSDNYPHICFVLKDANAKNSFLYGVNKKLENMGFDENEIHILATSIKSLKEDSAHVWFDAFYLAKRVALFEKSN